MTIEMKVTEQKFPVMLFIVSYNDVLFFEPVDEILNSGHSNVSRRGPLCVFNWCCCS